MTWASLIDGATARAFAAAGAASGTLPDFAASMSALTTRP
jgi:hypothetical protein